jgi:hypothetical protein
MALRTNRFNAQGYIGGIAAGGAEAWSRKRKDLLINLYVDEQSDISDKSGVPNGYNMGALLLPLKPGGMSSYRTSRMELTWVEADAKMGRNLELTASSAISVVNADLDQIIAMIASGTMSLAVASAQLSAGVQMEASSSMAISVSVAQLGGIIPAEVSGTITLSPSVVMSALANIEMTAGGATPLSPEGLAAALLDENDIETGYSLREALRLMLSSLGGKISGAGTTTITIRNVTDDKNRIIATVDSNGNRTSVTYDVSD